MNNINFSFMAFACGKESTETSPIKRYIGVAPVTVLAVNPNKKELESLYNTTLENEPNYIGESESNGTKVRNVRIDFIVKSVAEKCNGIDFTSKVSFFVNDEKRFNKDRTKVQVIDKYGRTAWVTVEQAKNHEIPIYSNGNPANIDKDYRPVYVGEEDLTNFIKAYLGIPNVMRYVDSKWIMVDKPEECEARLEAIDYYFKGDYLELRGAIALQPNNKVKVLFGVKTTDNNRQVQVVYPQMTLKYGVTDYSKLEKDVEERKANGAYPTTEFMVKGKIVDLQEYTVEATDFNKVDNAVDDLPFSTDSDNPWSNN